MKYEIYAGLYEEKNEGWIWTNDNSVKSGDYAQIKSKKGIFVCQIRKIDDNFRKYYSQPGSGRITLDCSKNVVVASKYYRDILGIDTDMPYYFEIKKVTNWHKKLLAMLGHPNDAIKTSIILAIISCCLGSIGLILGIISILT